MTSPQDDICSALDRHATDRPDRLALRFLHDGEADGAATELTFAALRARALDVAAALQQHLVPGDRALLLYEGGIDFATALLGCLYAGIIACRRIRRIRVESTARSRASAPLSTTPAPGWSWRARTSSAPPSRSAQRPRAYGT